MGKKRCRSKKVSRGLRPNITASTIRLCAPDPGQRLINKQKAWKLGQNPWVTIYDPTAAPGRQHRRLKANDVWGNPNRTFNIFAPKKEEQQTT